jgi:acetoacetyl-CoA synthetase
LVLPWEEAATRTEELTCPPVPFDHPLWVVFSSGTTGLPKGIVHGHGGVLLEHLKTLALQSDLGPGDRLLWYTTTHWMMWNLVVSTLLTGATTCTYDGSPALLTQPDILWELAARHRVTLFGTSPQYLLGMAKFGIDPTVHDLSAIRAVGCTGSALPASAHPWVRGHVGDRVQLASISGGTDVVSGFAGGAPVVPVWAGELSAPYLGVALAAYDEEGHPVVDQVGELVVTRPMPPMPLSFWNDPDGARYREAYFSTYPGVWRHGDWITLTSHGSVIVHGRSDSTLNRNGVRFGSADIHDVVERLPEITEALVIGAEEPDGGYWMPLFVVLSAGAEPDDALRDRIREAIRTGAWPRHVPDEIIEVPAIPHTRTGKKLEVPVKRLLQGAPVEQVVNPAAVDNPDLIHHYTRLGAERRAQRIGWLRPSSREPSFPLPASPWSGVHQALGAGEVVGAGLVVVQVLVEAAHATKHVDRLLGIRGGEVSGRDPVEELCHRVGEGDLLTDVLAIGLGPAVGPLGPWGLVDGTAPAFKGVHLCSRVPPVLREPRHDRLRPPPLDLPVQQGVAVQHAMTGRDGR